MIEIKANTQDELVIVKVENKDATMEEVLAIVADLLKPLSQDDKFNLCAIAIARSNQKTPIYEQVDDCYINKDLTDIMEKFKGDQMD